MKYTKTIVIAFVTVIILVGVYDVYLYINPRFTNLSKTVSIDTPRPVNTDSNDSNSKLITNVKDATVISLTAENKSVVMNARYQSIDMADKTIDGVNYSYVLGISDNNNALLKIWLTTDQYYSISSVVNIGNIDQGKPIKVRLTPTSISVENAF